MSALRDDVALAAQVAERLAAAGIGPDDPDYATLLDSETGLTERLVRMLRAARFAAADADTLGTMMSDMRERKTRLEAKGERLRGVVAWAMGEAGLKRLDAPDLTATLGAGRQRVRVTEEADLPDDAFQTTRKVSLSAIAKLIDRDSACPGAVLSNPEPAIVVRTR